MKRDHPVGTRPAPADERSGSRDNGDVTRGVRVAGDVHAVFEYIERKSDGRPTGST
ncbi:hypothetical protein [Wenjunlia tyrosinilytica]|uniref:hypothetical protein n=1 Tax=Wenjunlia tyrosinilytica TaxID=1544741 RepID=UPI00166F61A6|nr:hypothetical protein [Wenjunlia tyrosinilytica]